MFDQFLIEEYSIWMDSMKYGWSSNKKISVFRVTGLKILGMVGTHSFLNYILKKIKMLCILKGILPFKMHIIIFFPENLKKFFSRFHQ